MYPETLPSLDGIFSDSGAPQKSKLKVLDNRRVKPQKHLPEHKHERLEESPGGAPNSTQEYDEIVAQMSDRSRQVEASLSRTEAQLQALETDRSSYDQGKFLPILKAKTKSNTQLGNVLSSCDEALLNRLEQKYPEYADCLSTAVSRPHTSAEIRLEQRSHTSMTFTPDMRPGTTLRKKKRKPKSRAREPPSSDQPGVGLPTENDAGQVFVTKAVQAAALPWTRYYFPAMSITSRPLKQACGSDARPFFQYIDVQFPGPFSAPEQMIVEGSPEWVRKDWDQLYYIPNLPAKPKTGMETKAWPKVVHVQAQASLDPKCEYWKEGCPQLVQMQTFCKMVARITPRTAQDEKPLGDLVRALLEYLADQIERASRDAADMYVAKAAELKQSIWKELEAKYKQVEESIEETLSQQAMSMDKVLSLKSMVHGLKMSTKTKVSTLQKNKLDLSRQEALQQQQLLSQAEEEVATLVSEKEGLQTELQDERIKSEALADRLKEETQKCMEMHQKLLDSRAYIIELEGKQADLQAKAALSEDAEHYYARWMETQTELDSIRTATRSKLKQVEEEKQRNARYMEEQFRAAREAVTLAATKHAEKMEEDMKQAQRQQASLQRDFIWGQEHDEDVINKVSEEMLRLQQELLQTQGRAAKRQQQLDHSRQEHAEKVAALREHARETLLTGLEKVPRRSTDVRWHNFSADVSELMQYLANCNGMIDDASFSHMIGEVARITGTIAAEVPSLSAELAALQEENGSAADMDYVNQKLACLRMTETSIDDFAARLEVMKHEADAIITNERRLIEERCDEVTKVEHLRSEIKSLKEKSSLKEGTEAQGAADNLVEDMTHVAQVTNAENTLMMGSQIGAAIQRMNLQPSQNELAALRPSGTPTSRSASVHNLGYAAAPTTDKDPMGFLLGAAAPPGSSRRLEELDEAHNKEHKAMAAEIASLRDRQGELKSLIKDLVQERNMLLEKTVFLMAQGTEKQQNVQEVYRLIETAKNTLQDANKDAEDVRQEMLRLLISIPVDDPKMTDIVQQVTNIQKIIDGSMVVPLAALLDEEIPDRMPGTLQRVLAGVQFEAVSVSHKTNLDKALRGLLPEECRAFQLAAGQFSEAEQQVCPSHRVGASLCIILTYE